MKLHIDIVSDVVCPWCYIGKRRLEAALTRFKQEHADAEVSITWLPFFLDPRTPREGEPYRAYLEAKFGGPAQVDALQARVREAALSAGLELAFEKIRLRANTLDAHRLIHRVQRKGDAAAIVERLFAAHFVEGKHIGSREILADIAAECGEDSAATLIYLDSAEDVADVQAQVQRAQASGISGVPFFILNGRFGLSGAQPVETLLDAMRRAVA